MAFNLRILLAQAATLADPALPDRLDPRAGVSHA